MARKYDLNKIVNGLNDEELYTLQIMVTNKLRSNSRNNATTVSDAVVETVVAEPVKPEPVKATKNNTNPDMTPELIREGIVVHTIKDVMVSKGRRGHIVKDAEQFGGVKVWDAAIKKVDKYATIIKFSTESGAKKFMKFELEQYLKFNKSKA